MSFFFRDLVPAPALGTAVLLLAGAGTAVAAEADWSLTAGLEYRYFPSAPLHEQQHRGYPSIAAEPEAYWDWDDRDQSFTLRLFGRLDRYDDRRTHADVREAFYRYTGRDFEWRIGVRQVFWGVTEAGRLVDIINQTDFVEGVGGDDKLGQPMVNLAWFSGAGTVDLYLMPVFRERTFPGREGRPRPLLPVDTAAARTDHGLDGALRYFASFGGLDLGLSYFHGTNRDPRYATRYDDCRVTAVLLGTEVGPFSCDQAQDVDIPPDLPVDQVRIDVDRPRFAPVYRRIDQIGVDLQYVTGALALKAEAIRRRAADVSFTAATAGLEYTLYGIFGSGFDLGLLAEYLYDQRGRLDRGVAEAADRLSRSDAITFDSLRQAQAFQASVAQSQNAAVFQDDLFAGLRLSLNDLAGSEVLAGAIRDLDTSAVFASIEASRRFFGAYRFALTGQLFSNVPVTDPLYGFRDDDHLTLTVTRFF